MRLPPALQSPVAALAFGAVMGIAASANEAAAQDAPAQGTVAPYRARLLGVFNIQTGDVIEGAEVTDVLSRTTALTTKTGTVSLSFLPDGGSLVKIQKFGFEPKTIMVAISPVDTVPFTILLTPVAQTLPAVVTNDSALKGVSPGLRGFEERRRLGHGVFVTEAELRKSDNKSMAAVIRGLPNLNLVCPTRGARVGECWAITGRVGGKNAFVGGGCPIDIYLNGAVYTDNDLTKMKVDEYAAVEYYTGTAMIPALYNKTGSSCGVLLFWTRER